MSIKPLCSRPDDLGKFTFKEFRAKIKKALLKLSKKHYSLETAAPFFILTEHQYEDNPKVGFLLLFGKIKSFKKFAKESTKKSGVRGACYVAFDEETQKLTLYLMPVSGKFKGSSLKVLKAQKIAKLENRFALEYAEGDFNEALLDRLEAMTEELEETADSELPDTGDDEDEAQADLASEKEEQIDKKDAAQAPRKPVLLALVGDKYIEAISKMQEAIAKGKLKVESFSKNYGKIHPVFADFLKHYQALDPLDQEHSTNLERLRLVNQAIAELVQMAQSMDLYKGEITPLTKPVQVAEESPEQIEDETLASEESSAAAREEQEQTASEEQREPVLVEAANPKLLTSVTKLSKQSEENFPKIYVRFCSDFNQFLEAYKALEPVDKSHPTNLERLREVNQAIASLVQIAKEKAAYNGEIAPLAEPSSSKEGRAKEEPKGELQAVILKPFVPIQPIAYFEAALQSEWTAKVQADFDASFAQIQQSLDEYTALSEADKKHPDNLKVYQDLNGLMNQLNEVLDKRKALLEQWDKLRKIMSYQEYMALFFEYGEKGINDSVHTKSILTEIGNLLGKLELSSNLEDSLQLVQGLDILINGNAWEKTSKAQMDEVNGRNWIQRKARSWNSTEWQTRLALEQRILNTLGIQVKNVLGTSYTPKKFEAKSKINTGSGNTLVDLKDANKAASTAIQDVLNAEIDDRVLVLDRLLEAGKGKDSDFNFGAVMKWLVDDGAKNLVARYADATAALRAVPRSLSMDIALVFGLVSLRTKFLLEHLQGKRDPYARTAMAFGVLGNGWFSKELGDGMTFMKQDLSADQMLLLFEESTKTEKGSFRGEVARILAKTGLIGKSEEEKLSQEVKATALLMQIAAGDLDKAKGSLDEINKASKHKYSSAHDFYLCASFERLGANAFEPVLRDWLDKLPETVEDAEERRKLRQTMSYNSAFASSFLKEKVGMGIKGFKSADATRLKAIISSYTERIEGQEAQAILSEMRVLADEQNMSKRYSSEDLTQRFREMIFKADKKSPKTAIVKTFGDYKAWQAALAEGKTEEADKLLDSAMNQLQALMTKAKIEPEGREQILEYIYSDAAVGAGYVQLRKLAKSGNIKEIMAAVDDLDGESNELQAIRNDAELLNSLKCEALSNSRFRLDSTKKAQREQWNQTMTKLGLPPSQAEFDAVKNDPEAKAHLEQLAKLSDADYLPNREAHEAVNKDLQEAKKAAKKRGELGKPGMRGRFKLPKKGSEELAQVQAEQLAALEENPEYWAVNLAKAVRRGDKEGKIMLLAIEAQQAGMDLKQLGELAANMDSTFSPYVDKLKDSSSLKKMLGGEKLSSSAALDQVISEPVLRVNIKTENLTQIIETLDEASLLKDWFDTDKLLKGIHQKRDLMMAVESGQKTQEEVAEELKKTNALIMSFDIKTDVLKKLEGSGMKLDVAYEFRKTLRDKMVAAFQDPAKAKDLLQLLKEAGINHITEAELTLIGASLQSTAQIEQQAALETGLQWNSMSSRQLQRDLAASDALKANWDGRAKLAKIAALPRAEQEQELADVADKMKTANEDLAVEQAKFKETKEKYDEVLRKVITTVVAVIGYAAASLTGVGAAGLVAQLLFSAVQTALTSVINAATEKLIKGDMYSGQEMLKQALSDQIQGVISTSGGFALSKLKVADVIKALDIKATGGNDYYSVLTGPIKDAFVNAPQEMVDIMAGKMKEAIDDDFNFAKLAEIPGDLGNHLKDMFTDLPANYFKGVVTGFADMGLGAASEYLKHDGDFGGQIDEDIAKDFGIDLERDSQGNVINLMGYSDGDGTTLLSNFKENIKNPKVLANIATGLAQNQHGGESPSMYSVVENTIDEAYNKLKAQLAKEGKEVPEDAEIEFEQAKTELREALDKETSKLFTEQVEPNKAALLKANPELSEDKLAQMNLVQLKAALAKVPMPQSEEAVSEYLQQLAGDLPKDWYKVITKLKTNAFKEARSLESWAAGFRRAQHMLKDKAFVDDVLSGRIEKPYNLGPNLEPQTVRMDNQLIMTSYNSWQEIQKLLKAENQRRLEDEY